MDINTLFCNTLLRRIAQDLKAIDPDLGVRKSAWVINTGFRDHWEFHGPKNYYWHGSATCAIEARCNGWQAWLRSQQPSDESEADDERAENYDSTPWCGGCGARKQADCHCGPIAAND